MTKAEQFEALALRCEQAVDSDGNLDKAILLALGYSWRGMDYWHSDDKRIWRNPSNFTASLDAALTLVPEGWSVSVSINERHTWGQATMGRSYPTNKTIATEHRTPALALCAAALRARAQMERGK